MPSIRLSLAAAAMLSAAACGADGPPDSVSRMERSEVEAIVRAYLLENPEVITEALTELQRRDDERAVAQMLANTDAPSVGPADAPITIIEFFDYNCGYCKVATPWLSAQLEHPNKDVRVIFKEFPILEDRTQSSEAAARAALAAHKQGKYLEMHMALMAEKPLTAERIEPIARGLGLDVERLKRDMESRDVTDQIATNFELAQNAGVNATPGFFINGKPLLGFSEELLDEMMAEARQG
jgi:protein-disulfide isomerase